MLVNRLKLGYNLWKICSLVISVIIRQTWDQNIRLSCFPFLINFITADCFNFLKQYWSYNVKKKTKPLISRIFLKAITLEDLFGPKKMKMNEIKVLIVLRAALWDIYWAILKKSFVHPGGSEGIFWLMFLVGGWGLLQWGWKKFHTILALFNYYDIRKSNFYLLNLISMIPTQANQDLYILWLVKYYFISLIVYSILSLSQ